MSETSTAPQPAARRRNGLTLLLLAFAFLAPFIAAVVMRFGGWQPDSTRNFGELLQPPVPMHALQVRDEAGKPWVFENTEHHWSMLVAVPEPCDAACAAHLELVRNVRASMGRHQARLSIWQIAGAGVPELPRLQLEGERPPVLQHEVAATEVWLVDPHGYLVLHYPAGFEPRGLRRDLGRLIK